MKIKLYIGCAILSQGAERQKVMDRITNLQNVLRDKGFEILDFIKNPDAPVHEVYESDIVECISICDAMLAICDHPSTGLGYELATAVEKRGIPVLAVAHRDARVSKVVLGISKPSFRFERYGDFEKDIPVLAERYFMGNK